MSEPKNIVTYNLMDGDEVVYKGITKDPKRREQEHRAEGLKFTEFLIISHPMSAEVANRRAWQDLDRYRMNHQGQNPKYNKSYWGKRKEEALSK